MQNNYCKKIGERLKQLRSSRKDLDNAKSGYISVEKLLNEFCFLYESTWDSDKYSNKEIKISYSRSEISKIEMGEILPSTDYLYLIHEYFKKSFDYLVFGHTLSEIEEFIKILKSLSESKQNSLIYRCIELAEKSFEKDRDDELEEDDEKFNDYIMRINEVRKNFCKHKKITQLDFCGLIGSSKNTMQKYHSLKNDIDSEKYIENRNSALGYLIKFCLGTEVSLDYLLYGTYSDEEYPIELSDTLWCYDYEKQIEILILWLEEAKDFRKKS